MNDERHRLPELNVNVLLPGSYRDAVGNITALDSVTRYLQILLRSLDIPLRPEVKFSVGSQEERSDQNYLRLTIHDTTVTLAPVPNEDPDSLTYRLSHALYRCRELFINDNVARCLWVNWFSDRAGRAEDKEFLHTFRKILRELVRCGFRSERVRARLSQFDNDALNPRAGEHIFEESIAETHTTSVRIFLSREHYARCFDVSSGLARALPGEKEDLLKMLEMMSDGLFWELGLAYRLDPVTIDDDLESPWFRMEWNDIRLPPMKGLANDQFLVNDTVDRLQLLNLKGEPAVNPANRSECATLRGDVDIRQNCEKEKLTVWGPEGYLVLQVSSEIRENAGAFMTLSLLGLYLTQLSQAFPDLVDEAERRFGRMALSRTLRFLLDEELSIRDLRSILDGLLAVDGVTTIDLSRFIVFAPHTSFPCPISDGRSFDDLTAEDYAECARIMLRRYISHKYTRGGNTLVVYLLDPDIEARMADVGTAPLSISEHNGLLGAIRHEIGALPASAQNPVILTTANVRRQLRQLTRHDFPMLPALSYQELSPDMNIQPIARISWAQKMRGFDRTQLGLST